MNGQWSEVDVGGHPCDVYEPTNLNEPGFVVIYLHDVEGRRMTDQAQVMALFDQFGLPVVCPNTGQSWWTDRPSPAFSPTLSAEQHVLENVLPYVTERWSSHVGLLGFDMGGQGALRLAYRHPDRLRVVAAIAPAVDFQLLHREGDPVICEMYADREAARQDTATLHIHPLNWPRQQFFCCDPVDYRWMEGVDRLRMKLWSLGIPHECDLETSAGGHDFAYAVHMMPRAVKFVAEGLDKERRRLV